jgi:trk system potassium uptake protein TrkA
MNTSSGVLVVGLGRFGEAVALTLVDQGVDVLAIDLDEDIVQRLSGEIPNVVQADATSARALRQAGAEQFDHAVVAIATNVESSVLATLVLKEELRIPTIWAKAISKPHARILESMGVQLVVQPEHEMGIRTARSIAQGVTDYFRIEENFALVEMEVPASLVGQSLGEIEIRRKYGVTIVSVKPPRGQFQYATADTVLERGEMMLVAGTPQDLERLTGSV